MDAEDYARLLSESIARHQSRGVVDDATGLTDVVIHGRADLVAVAEDMLAASPPRPEAGRRSWAAWFARGARARRHVRQRQALARQLRERLASLQRDDDA